MTEPISANKSFILPNTGDLPGAWGTSALNPDFQTIDALFGGVTTITLSSATTLLLTVPATTGVWPGTLSQSVNSLIKFTGAQSGAAIVQFTLPGYYIINNQCTGTSYVQLAPASGTGNAVGAPPGQKIHVFFDGTDMDYVNMPTPGAALDLHTNTTTLPPWMTACTVRPYLIKDGSIYTSSVYPALAQLLGSSYGGNGLTTFGVPDERARVRIGVDTIQAASGATSARITVALGGINASSLGAAGGTAAATLVTGNLPPYTPAGSVSLTFGNGGSNSILWTNGQTQVASGSGFLNISGFTVLSASFSGSPQGGTSTPVPVIPPTQISSLPLIKT
jgi:microcystin-dependent protein